MPPPVAGALRIDEPEPDPLRTRSPLLWFCAAFQVFELLKLIPSAPPDSVSDELTVLTVASAEPLT